MNKFVTIGLGAAAVVVAVFVGAQLFGFAERRPGLSAHADPSRPTPEPSPSVAAGLPEGPYLLSEGTDGGVAITVTIAAPLGRCAGATRPRRPQPPPAAPARRTVRDWSPFKVASTSPTGMPATGQAAVGRTPSQRPSKSSFDALRKQVHRRVATSIEDIMVDGFAGKKIILDMAHQAGPTTQSAATTTTPSSCSGCPATTWPGTARARARSRSCGSWTWTA